ncbi:VOC family protein [soil metagenome]
MTQTHHTIDYIELAAPDLEESKGFYSRVFAWHFNDYGSDYAGIQSPSGEGEVGGLDRAGTAGSGAPLVIIYSSDLSATLDAVKAAGGRISVEPFDFPGGRRFHFIDPGGNELGVFTSA